MTVIFVAHSLSDVLAASDVVTVMRDGSVVLTNDCREVTADLLIEQMIGRSLGAQFPHRTDRIREPEVVLEAEGIRRRPQLGPVDVKLHAGEILGIAGLPENGQTELLRCLVGADRRDSGTVRVGGSPLPRAGVLQAKKAGLVLLPEDRKVKGLHLNLSLRDNICLPHLQALGRFGFLPPKTARARAEQAVAQFGIKATSVHAPIPSLSGGNQQRVLFAKWLAERPKVLIASEPTRGIDVAGKRAIYDFVVSLASEGIGVIIGSSELAELVGLCDRVLVMRGGQIVGELTGEQIDERSITELAFGARQPIRGLPKRHDYD